MLWAVVLLLVLLWALGLVGSIGGDLIHFLLVLALIVVIFNLFFTEKRVDP